MIVKFDVLWGNDVGSSYPAILQMSLAFIILSFMFEIFQISN